jgi:hypothetical protein
MQYLSSGNSIFLIDFRGTAQHFIFENKAETLGKLIALYGKHGIISIKKYNPTKENFKKLSKKEVISRFNWDTHSIIELEKTNFLK